MHNLMIVSLRDDEQSGDNGNTDIKKPDYEPVALITPFYDFNGNTQAKWNEMCLVFDEITEMTGSRSGVHNVISSSDFKFYKLNLNDVKCDGVGDILVDEPFYNWKDRKRYIYNGDTIKDENGKPPVFEIDGITVNVPYVNDDDGLLYVFDGTSIKKLDYKVVTLLTPRYKLDKSSAQYEFYNVGAVRSELAEVTGSQSGTAASTSDFRFYTFVSGSYNPTSIEDIPVNEAFYNAADKKFYVYDGTEIKIKEE